MRQLLLILMLCLMGAGLHAQTKDYCNARYGYCISYNPALLKAEPEAQNGDGRMFKDTRGVERFSVYGTGNWNFNDEGTAITLAQLYQQELKGGRFPEKGAHRVVTYKAIGKRSFVISGTESGELFYMKVVQHDDAFCYARLHYPAAEAEKYRPVAVLIAQSFN